MTVTDKAKEIVSAIRLMNDTDAAEYLRAHLSLAYAEGGKSGIQQVRQSLNDLYQTQAAE